MDRLYEYFHGEYVDQKRQIRRIDATLKKVWQTLSDCYCENDDAKGWPYDVADGAGELTLAVVSQSTNSMILFAMCLALGLIKDSRLVPKLQMPLGADLSGELRDRMRNQIPGAVAGIIQHRAKEGNADPQNWQFAFKSGTYGKDDPFTMTWFGDVLATIEADPSLYETLKEHVEEDLLVSFIEKQWERRIDRVTEVFDEKPKAGTTLDARKKPLLLDSPIDHSFPLLRFVQLGRSLADRHAAIPELLVGKAEAISAGDAFASFGAAFIDVVHTHLSHHHIQDAPFDAGELVFSMEGALLCDPQTTSFDRHVINEVFRVLSDRQQRSAYWRPLKPFVTTSQGLALLPVSIEIAGSMLRICCILEEAGEDEGRAYFSSYLPMFRQYVDWLMTRVAHGTFGDAAARKTFTGWHSEHVSEHRKIHTWETSLVAAFLLCYRHMLHRHIGDAAATAGGFAIRRPKRSKSLEAVSATDFWRNSINPGTPSPLMKEPLQGISDDSQYAVMNAIGNTIVAPRSVPPSEVSPDYSLLLYGPPGTGKTAIAEDIADALDWRMVEITPSDFVARGEAEVEMRAKYIFKALEEQASVVVLFDEIDRLIMDRDCKLYREQSDMFQFMTPGMLPKLKSLREARNVIFVIGTNYNERIDPAAKRTGRIDRRLLVAPPNMQQRLRILKERICRELKDVQACEKMDLADDDLKEIAKQTVLAVFGEIKQLVEASCKALVGQDIAVNTKDVLLEKLAAEWPKQERPGLDLLAFRARLETGTGNEHRLTTQRPVDEFLMVLYLLIEAEFPAQNRDPEAERRFAHEAIAELDPELSDLTPANVSPGGNKRERMEQLLERHIRDEAIRNQILSEPLSWLE